MIHLCVSVCVLSSASQCREVRCEIVEHRKKFGTVQKCLNLIVYYFFYLLSDCFNQNQTFASLLDFLMKTLSCKYLPRLLFLITISIQPFVFPCQSNYLFLLSHVSSLAVDLSGGEVVNQGGTFF